MPFPKVLHTDRKTNGHPKKHKDILIKINKNNYRRREVKTHRMQPKRTSEQDCIS